MAEVLRTHDLESHESRELRRLLGWFDAHLVVPACLREADNERAICWFTDGAQEPLRAAWELVVW